MGVLRGPKTTPRPSDLLERLIGFIIELYSRLRFIILKGYKAKSASKMFEKALGEESKEKQVQSSKILSSWSHRHTLIPVAVSYNSMS